MYTAFRQDSADRQLLTHVTSHNMDSAKFTLGNWRFFIQILRFVRIQTVISQGDAGITPGRRRRMRRAGQKRTRQGADGERGGTRGAGGRVVEKLGRLWAEARPNGAESGNSPISGALCIRREARSSGARGKRRRREEARATEARSKHQEEG